MKTLSEICQLIKGEYLKGGYTLNEVKGEVIYKHPGMCSALDQLWEEGKLSSTDVSNFDTEYYNFIKKRRIFYTSEGNKTLVTGQFAWRVSNRSARIKWLNKRI